MIYPFTKNGYVANNEDELRELYECDVISLAEFEALTSSDIQEIDKTLHKRKSYKKLFLEEKGKTIYLNKRCDELYKKLCETIKENLVLKGENNE